MIPKIFQLVSEPKDQSGWHEKWKYCVSTMEKYCPDFEFKFWDKQEIFDFCEENEPEIFEIIKEFPNHKWYNCVTFDVFMYVILKHQGGCYLDLDIELFKDITPLLKKYDLIVPLQPNACDAYVGTAALMSVPGHQLWENALTEFKSHTYYAMEKLQDEYYLAGPNFLESTITKYYFKMINDRTLDQSKTYFMPWDLFHVGDDKGHTLKRSTKKQGYAFHRSTGDWK